MGLLTGVMDSVLEARHVRLHVVADGSSGAQVGMSSGGAGPAPLGGSEPAPH